MSILSSFELNEKEQDIYLAALELGESLQLPLAKKAGLKRTTLRDLLPKMFEQGLLSRVIRGKREYIVAADPRVLVKNLQAKASLAEQALPELLAMQNSLNSKPVLRFFEGIEGVKSVYLETLRVGQPIYSFIEIDSIHPEIQKWLSNEYSKERERRKINAYNIVNASDKLDAVMPKNEYRTNLMVSSKEYPFRMEILSFGDYVAYIHFRQNEDPSAVLIQSQAAALTMRSIHKLFWK